MRRNRQKEKTPDASGHMAAAPGVCCYLFVLVCEIEFLAVIVRIRHTFQLGKGLLGQRPHIPVHTRHGCGDLAYRPASVCVVVHACKVDYVKWDMNRSVDNVFSAALPRERQGEVYHRYVLAVYEMMESLVQRYPDLLFEGCSGGGGRFEAGMLYYSPQIWCRPEITTAL